MAEEKTVLAYITAVNKGKKTTKGTPFAEVLTDAGDTYCITEKYCKIQPKATYAITYSLYGQNRWISKAVSSDTTFAGKEKPTEEQKKAPPSFNKERYDMAVRIYLSLISGQYGQIDYVSIPKDIEAIDVALANAERGVK